MVNKSHLLALCMTGTWSKLDYNWDKEEAKSRKMLVIAMAVCPIPSNSLVQLGYKPDPLFPLIEKEGIKDIQRTHCIHGNITFISTTSLITQNWMRTEHNSK